jgi:exodeoxyribonuclease VII large subunit
MKDRFDLPFEEADDDVSLDQPSAAPPPSADRVRASNQHPAPSTQRPASSSQHPAPSDYRRILTVTELTIRVRDALEVQVGEVWVEGELSNCRLWNTGHLYFTLKDSSSQLRGFMFKSALRYLRFKPVDGTRVVARGRITVYEPKGEYQLVCEHLEPQGVGALQLAFEQLKRRLEADGLFDVARKRPLPALPRKIGIVTSLDGAAIRDIIKVLRRRYANAHLVISPARVQGADAAPEIARSLRQISRVPGVDVVIVGRGGGSMEDLWAFNEELVARAIARVPVPVISAVGHETDVTIADFVADVRAPTPSAAAELVVARKDEFCGRIDRLQDRLTAALRSRAQALSRRVHMISGRPAFAAFPARLAMRGRHVAELGHGLKRVLRDALAARSRRVVALERQLSAFDVGRRLAGFRSRLVAAETRLRNATVRRHDRANARLRTTIGRLETLSPLAVLGRGYAVAWTSDKTSVIRDAASVQAGAIVQVTLARGELECAVRRTNLPGEDADAVPGRTGNVEKTDTLER